MMRPDSCVDDSLEEEQANARLIAAAPELLAACKALLEEHYIFPIENGRWRCPFCTADTLNFLQMPHSQYCPVLLARAAIAMAEGTKP